MTRNVWIGIAVTLVLAIVTSVGGWGATEFIDKFKEVRVSMSVHDTDTRPRLRLVEQQSKCNWCHYECEEICRNNGISLEECNCDHCDRFCQ